MKCFKVFYSVVSVMHDHKYFEEPSVFRPDRFINNQGEFVPDEKVIYFGTGKRRCVGEILGRAEMYIFSAALLKVRLLSKGIMIYEFTIHEGNIIRRCFVV